MNRISITRDDETLEVDVWYDYGDLNYDVYGRADVVLTNDEMIRAEEALYYND